MAVACHRIGVLEIELRLEEEPQAHPLMDRVSALREPRLEAVMQRVLDELSVATLDEWPSFCEHTLCRSISYNCFTISPKRVCIRCG
jgi:hypothetical protein